MSITKSTILSALVLQRIPASGISPSKTGADYPNIT